MIQEAEEFLEKQKKDLERMKTQRKELQEALAYHNEMRSEDAKNRLQCALSDLILTIAGKDIEAYEEGLKHGKEQLAEKKEQLKEFEEMFKRMRREKEAEAEIMKKAKFKPGDHVRVSKNPVRPHDSPEFDEDMEPFKGQVVTIESCYGVIDGEIIYHIVEDDKHWAERWLERWLEPVSDKKRRLDH